MICRLLLCQAAWLLLIGPAAGDPVALEQVISREDPRLRIDSARLSVGQDGNVYLGNGFPGGGYLLRISPDGKQRKGGPVGYSFTASAVSKDGTIATSEAHFSHCVTFHDKDFTTLGAVNHFTASDATGWNVPSDVQVGASGDFYALDRYRIVKLQQPDKLLAAYSLELPSVSKAEPLAFRVSEQHRRFWIVWSDGKVRATGFDGKPIWEVDRKPAGDPPQAFDVDELGKLWVLSSGDEVKSFDVDGRPTFSTRLRPESLERPYPITGLRVLGDTFLIKRSDPMSLFEVYSRASGIRLRRVPADVEVLHVDYRFSTWMAGSRMPFTVHLDSGKRIVHPNFRIWMRPLGVPEFTELTWKDDTVAVPADARGLYQVRVTPDVRGRVAEYCVDGYVEVRVPDSLGSLSILTPLNRFYYGRGEEIPVSVIARAPAIHQPRVVMIRLMQGEAVVAERRVEMKEGQGNGIFSGDLTQGLHAGRYRIDVELPGFTVAQQYLEIGPGLKERPRFHITQYGDYNMGFPSGRRFSDLPEIVEDHLARSHTLGLNLFVDRLGHPSSGLGDLLKTAEPETLISQLRQDRAAVAPEKARFEGTVRRILAGYSADSIEEQGILLYMDAGLPLGTPFDERSPIQMEKDLLSASKAMLPYPAFRGWSWAANWWLAHRGADAAANGVERAIYLSALKIAKQTGKWSEVLETVSNRNLALSVEAEQRFRKVQASVAPGKLSVLTAPYRAVEQHPPIIFRNADEVDLHYQAEQIQPPQATGHEVDFYRRPGKPAWGHPELWNDDGTGGMIYPTLLQMAMRGVNGVGQSGPVGPGFNEPNPDRINPRCGGAGSTSVFRAIYTLLGRYGDWMAGMENADRVAILVSTRMQRIETWDGKIGGSYFDSLFEAYNACLYAHRPASFVFAEDVKPDMLLRYEAVIVVDQRVELDPPLLEAMQSAHAAGVPIFNDSTCRPGLVPNSLPLGIAFDRVRQDPSAWQDDAAYDRFPRYFREHAQALDKILSPHVAPVAECGNPEVLLSERRSGEGRYIWVVNNTMLGWDLGLAWRATMMMTHRVPLVEKIKLDVPAGMKVYEVFAKKEVDHENGIVYADLRTMPARLFAILPAGVGLPPWGKEPAIEEHFGPHVRDLVVNANGTTALLNTFNWDHNLYALDLETGSTRWRKKVGDTFAFAPEIQRGGFAIQGFDIHSPEGYHLYLLGSDGQAERRFALFGLPKRATSWAIAEHLLDPGINNFAVAPDGSWVASAGNLGLVVWDRAGKVLWSDPWWQKKRKRVHLSALSNDSLLVLDGKTARVHMARAGKVEWSRQLAESGTLLGAIISGDGRTIAIRSDELGGRLLVLRGGAVINTIPAQADQAALSTDGTFLVAVEGRQLKAYNPAAGLLWTYTGNDTLRHPKVSADGKRIAVGSELGMLTVLDRNGTILAEKDLHALPVPAWLPDEELLAATWMGTVVRYDTDLHEKWRTILQPNTTDERPTLLEPDPTPTVRLTGLGNAKAEPLPLVPNLLASSKALIIATHDPVGGGDPLTWQNPIAGLTDGKPDSPAKPWLGWTDIGYIDSGWRGKFVLKVDTFRTQLRVTAITFVEDSAHPESWLRDVQLQWWDAGAEAWRDGPMLLSDVATHSHILDKPIEAAQFRFVTTGGGTWPVSNIRLGELVFHGESLGPSHPDVLHRKTAAVLFDEKESDLKCLGYPGRPFRFRYSGAYSGGKCLELSSAGEVIPEWRPPFGHALPNWDFEIAENPKPGQYRYLQFAWKAASPRTTGMSLLIGKEWPAGGVAVTVGDAKWDQGVIAEQKIEGKPPKEWETVRVDLWALTKGKLPRVQSLELKSVGGGALFDQIVLGRTEADLPERRPKVEGKK